VQAKTGTHATTHRDRRRAAHPLRRLLTALLFANECAADVALLGYGPLFAAIDTATRSLGEALGRNDGSGRTIRSQRLRDALSQCVTAFNLTLAELEEGVSRLPEGPARARYVALQAPLRALLDRAPAASATPPADPSTPAG